MKRIVLYFLFLNSFTIAGQDMLRTYFGDAISPVDTFRVLNIFININYDQCDTCDPLYGQSTPYWEPGAPNTVNTSLPGYLTDFMDTDINGDTIHGTFTKLLAQASFNALIVLGDNVVVNIAKSKITPVSPKRHFSMQSLIDSSIALINQQGGLHTIGGHNSINDFDGSVISENLRFKRKVANFNGKIDFMQFFVRNCTPMYGSLGINQGRAKTAISIPLKIDTGFYFNDAGIIQGVGGQNLSNPETIPKEIHEIAHNILGMTNSAHMGGGGPLNVGDLTTLESNSGWSLLGGSYSCLVSCSGFDRWRLNWRGPTNSNYPVAVQNENADIKKADGPKTFYLRDFITFGDAVRIMLPYKDEGALNQYLWIENHQIHTNGKIDYPCYWEFACKDDGIPGLFAYYQVGKDIREGYTMNDLFTDLVPSYTDHLVPVCADGKWDVVLDSTFGYACVAGGSINIQKYIRENPFSGYHDLGNHFFNSSEGNTLNWIDHRQEILIKLQKGQLTNKIASMGDNQDPFTGACLMNISSNPAPVNVVTYHHYRPDMAGTIHKSKRVDNRRIHLSGLRIEMTDQQNGIFKVSIRWNDFDVTDDVRWTGDIALHDTVNLMSGRTITFDQNSTPNKHIRDNITGLFAGPTYFTCLKNSSFIMKPSSRAILQNLSSFIIESGGNLEINDSAIFAIKKGTTLHVKSGGTLIVKGSGKVEIEDGGYICVENGASLVLNDVRSAINLRPGFLLGKNDRTIPGPVTFYPNPASIDYSGKGSVNAYYSTPDQ